MGARGSSLPASVHDEHVMPCTYSPKSCFQRRMHHRHHHRHIQPEREKAFSAIPKARHEELLILFTSVSLPVCESTVCPCHLRKIPECAGSGVLFRARPRSTSQRVRRCRSQQRGDVILSSHLIFVRKIARFDSNGVCPAFR